MKFGRPLAIIVHYTRYKSIWSVAKALCQTGALILF